jgi:hypothetical protein
MFSLTVCVLENQSLEQTGHTEQTGPIPGKDRPEGPLRIMEHAARAAIERGAGRCLNDGEWTKARSRLLDFSRILRGWDRGAETPDREVGSVDTICQQEH